MKKYLFVVLIFVVISLMVYLFTPNAVKKSTIVDPNFVSINKNTFRLNGKNFYPVALNYMLGFQVDNNEIWPCQSTSYYYDSKNEYLTKDSCLMQLKAQMDLIKEMGFNVVRIVGVDIKVDSQKQNQLSIKAKYKNQRDTTFLLSTEEQYQKYFNALGDLFQVINHAGLKVIFLANVSVDYKITENYLSKLSTYFKNDTSLMAYDFFNEPLYFDKPERDKEEVYEIVKKWRKIIKRSAPNHLCTIGLEGIREVFEWDPGILDLDFISLHPYEYEPEQVRNEIYWYGKYIKKPWIIGETAIPADNDSVTYEEQRLFAKKTLKQAYDCGASGYSWWQYKDVEWGVYHANFMGVLNNTGETKTQKENILVKGTPKPLVEEFKKFNSTLKKEDCLCLENYYNYSQGKVCRIIGCLMDENSKPIEGGVILAWNQWWTSSYHTITKADGTFELLGTFPFYHWMASATEHSMVRGELLPDTAKIAPSKIPTMRVGILKLSRLHFINN